MTLTFSDTHTLGAILAKQFVEDGAIKSQRYFVPDDLDCPLPEGKIVKVTLEYVPFSECEPAEKE